LSYPFLLINSNCLGVNVLQMSWHIGLEE